MQLTNRKALITIVIGLGIIVAAGIGLQRLVVYVHELHPNAITQAMASWELEYAKTPTDEHFERQIGILEYVRNYYPYEHDPNYKGTELAKMLAAQRERTLQAIAKGLKESSGQDFGTDEKAWRDWYAKNWAKMK